jgi:6-phosphofructokinase 1
MRRIGLLTSGGDAPGMNAAIRAVVRHALGRSLEVVGIRRGFAGLLAGELQPLTRAGVANIIQHGGTILGTSRSAEFLLPEGRARAASVLRGAGIEGLVTIGGDGTFRGATLLLEEHRVAVAGVPGTIDNDVYGTDFTIGFDTAVNTALEAIDRIRDTAASHERIFLVEVMGRTCGDIALGVGVAGGAEEVLIPEIQTDLLTLAAELRQSWERGKRSSIIVVAESGEQGRSFRLAEEIERLTGLQPRVCVFGHIQRGGTPTARDRVLASRLGTAAVDILLDGGGMMAGDTSGAVVRVAVRPAGAGAGPRVTEAALADYPKTVVLKDGTHVLLRPMTATDREAVTALHDRLAPGEGRTARVETADAIVLACDAERVVAAALLERTAPDAAAVTVVLDPAYRGRRLGTWMLLDCVHLAAGLGLARLESVAPAGDEARLAALRRLDFVERPDGASASAVVFVKTLHATWTDF